MATLHLQVSLRSTVISELSLSGWMFEDHDSYFMMLTKSNI